MSVAHDSPGAASYIAHRGLRSLRDLTLDQQTPLDRDGIAPVRQRDVRRWWWNILQKSGRRHKTVIRPMETRHLLRSKDLLRMNIIGIKQVLRDNGRHERRCGCRSDSVISLAHVDTTARPDSQPGADQVGQSNARSHTV